MVRPFSHVACNGPFAMMPPMTNHAANIFRARMLAAARWGINGQTEAGS